jgi:PAS domain S-box-containing protein
MGQGDGERLRRLIGGFADPVLLLAAIRDEAGEVVDFEVEAINDAALAVLGMSSQEMAVGARLSEGRSVLFDAYRTILATGEAQELQLYGYENEYRGRRVSGDFELRAAPVGDAILLTGRDVSPQRRAEAARLEAQENFRIAFDHAPIGMALIDLEGRYLAVNPAFCRTFGRDADELLEMRFFDVTHPEDRAGSQALMRAMLSGKRDSARVERRYLRGDGSVLWGEASVALIRGADGEPRLFVSQIRDLTERRRYEREHELAVTLQRSLLPSRLPTVANASVAVRYRPGAPGVEVGGDWYDVVSLPTGEVGIAVGDVAGRGVPAAAVMGQLRTALRVFALSSPSPARVVASLNDFMRALDEPDMATLVYVVLDPETGALRYTSAGHPPALVVSADGRVRRLEGSRSVPIGVANGRYDEATDRLEPGETLVAYTDGLVEEPGRPLDAGLERLEGAIAGAGGEVDDFCAGVLDATLAGTSAHDDVALLALRFEPLAPGPLRLRLPARVTAPAEARRALRAWLAGTAAGDRMRYEVVAAASEAVANVVEHAYGPVDAEFEVEARVDGREVVVEVRDFGSWRPPRARGRGRGTGLMEALMDGVEVDAGEGGTAVRLRRLLAGREASA